MYLELLLLSLGLTGVASLLWLLYQYFADVQTAIVGPKAGKNDTDSIFDKSRVLAIESNTRDVHATTRVHIDSVSGINELASLTTDNINLNPNDGHNVHNVTIVNTVKSKINSLRESDGQECSVMQIIRQIRDYVDTEKPDLPHLNTVLKFILKSRARYSADKIPEFDILKLIWRRINGHQNIPNRDQLLSELVTQLNDCFETDKQAVCCLEGRIIRYFQVLELHDFERSEWALVPLWYYKEEIERLCARRLDEMVNGLPLEDQMVYLKTDPTSDEQLRVESWNQQLIDNLKGEIDGEYAGRVEASLLEGIVKPCFDAIWGDAGGT